MKDYRLQSLEKQLVLSAREASNEIAKLRTALLDLELDRIDDYDNPEQDSGWEVDKPRSRQSSRSNSAREILENSPNENSATYETVNKRIGEGNAESNRRHQMLVPFDKSNGAQTDYRDIRGPDSNKYNIDSVTPESLPAIRGNYGQQGYSR